MPIGEGGAHLLADVMLSHPPSFALIHRPQTQDPDRIDLVMGDVAELDTLGALDLQSGPSATGAHRALVLIPFRQARERRYECIDDGSALLVMNVTQQTTVSRTDVLERVADVPTGLIRQRFDVEDGEYAEVVGRVIQDAIGRGEGSNFVLSRSLIAQVADYSPPSALAVFRRLLLHETGAYWTFIAHLGGRTLVGSTPERHISVSHGNVTMCPISGTYMYPTGGPTLRRVLRFLGSVKETFELFMVLDEELKMMARMCEAGGQVSGPYWREMVSLAHTEYLIQGTTRWNVSNVLRHTMFSPAVVGSPLENAFRVISRYEAIGRGYYAGVVALVGESPDGLPSVDSAILIRTADVDAQGHVRIGVGGTVVRDSNPQQEVAETAAKASQLIAAFNGADSDGNRDWRSQRRYAQHPRVTRALQQRNRKLSTYWLAPQSDRNHVVPLLYGRKTLVVDAEDEFTAMLAQLLDSLGLTVEVRDVEATFEMKDYDIVVAGPGPGDPRDNTPKLVRMRDLLRQLLDTGQPFLAVCLGHQLLCGLLGLRVVRRSVPNQGTQRQVEVFGRRELVGFYNSFVAEADHSTMSYEGPVGDVDIWRDPSSTEVHALRGRTFRSVQFHAESVLTVNGVAILGSLLSELVDTN